MAVVGVLVEAGVGHEDEGVADLVAQAAAARPGPRRRGRRRRSRARPCAAGTPKRITAGTPRPASVRTSLRRLSWVCWTTPGIDTTGSGSSMPSFTKSGATRSSTRQPGLGGRGGASRRCDGAGATGARGIPRRQATAAPHGLREPERGAVRSWCAWMTTSTASGPRWPSSVPIPRPIAAATTPRTSSARWPPSSGCGVGRRS